MGKRDMKTLYQQAKFDELEELDIFSTIDRIQEISTEIKLTDLINPTSRQMGLIAELLWRVERINISPIDIRTVYGGVA
tara:strand:+ start:940 stop:1176 length:237 start_codon:yes stop_codon:yes gene_type:complete